MQDVKRDKCALRIYNDYIIFVCPLLFINSEKNMVKYDGMGENEPSNSKTEEETMTERG